MQETQETLIQCLGRDGLLEEGMATYSSNLTWRIPWKGSLAGYSQWGRKESDTTEHAHVLCCNED